MRAAGFEARVVEARDLQPVKTRLAVPIALQSCHTAEIGGYAIEGHVPASAVKRLLAERPTALGLAVPGMPVDRPAWKRPEWRLKPTMSCCSPKRARRPTPVSKEHARCPDGSLGFDFNQVGCKCTCDVKIIGLVDGGPRARGLMPSSTGPI